MIAFAKAVTNGAVPLSGMIVRRDLYEAQMQGPKHVVELFHGYTYSGHPLATAAALATLDLYRSESLFERARAFEGEFAAAMMSLRQEPHVADIRTVGLLCGIDLVPIADQPGVRGYEALERSYHELDLYIRVTGDTLIVAPPLILDVQSLDEIRDKTAKLLRALA